MSMADALVAYLKFVNAETRGVRKCADKEK